MRVPTLVIAAALLALGRPALASETSTFLGPEADWGRARIELRDVPTVSGTDAVAVEGTGRTVVRLIQADKTEHRWQLLIDKKEALALVKLVVDQDLLGAKLPEGTPDGPTITVRNAQGLARTVAKGDKDPVPAFDKVRAALLALKKRTEGKPVERSGRHDPSWRPFEGVTATVSMYSGRPDPTFELTAPEDFAKLKALIADLPETPRGPQGPPKLGYRGILLNPRGVPGLPAWISGAAGVVELGDTPETRAFKKDAKGLEAWLLGEAKKRGIVVPK